MYCGTGELVGYYTAIAVSLVVVVIAFLRPKDVPVARRGLHATGLLGLLHAIVALGSIQQAVWGLAIACVAFGVSAVCESIGNRQKEDQAK